MVREVLDSDTNRKGIRKVIFEYEVNNKNDIKVLEMINDILNTKQRSCLNCNNFVGYQGSVDGKLYPFCGIYDTVEEDYDGEKCEDYSQKGIM